MAELDLSGHLLNNSSSKQKFSFPKTERFRMQQKILYLTNHIDAIATIKYPVRAPVEPPHLASDIRILDSSRISSLLLLAPTISAQNSRKISPKVSPSEVAET